MIWNKILIERNNNEDDNDEAKVLIKDIKDKLNELLHEIEDYCKQEDSTEINS